MGKPSQIAYSIQSAMVSFAFSMASLMTSLAAESSLKITNYNFPNRIFIPEINCNLDFIFSHITSIWPDADLAYSGIPFWYAF